MMAEPTLDDLKKELHWYSGAVSKAVRTAAFGVIAAIWAIFTADGIVLQASGLFGVSTNLSVRLAFVFSSAALLTDIVQYVSAYWMTNIGYGRFETKLSGNASAKFLYNTDNLGCFGLFLYKLSFWLFPLKLVFAVLSALAFLFLAFGVDVGG